jgi:hypothetical protein
MVNQTTGLVGRVKRLPEYSKEGHEHLGIGPSKGAVGTDVAGLEPAQAR